MNHRLDPSILREYDIRGVIGESLDEDSASAIGRAFGTMARRLGVEHIAVGFDGRLSSRQLAESLSAGLMAAGMDVVAIGCGPTPLLYYATHLLSVGGGIMVTGSHNPPDYNGFKMTLGGKPFFGADIQELGEIVALGAFAAGSGRLETENIVDRYIARLCQDFHGDRALKVAWDAGNGAAGEVMALLTQRLPGQHTLLNETVDGTFPNHHPDPTVPDNLAPLQSVVVSEGCDLGIAFDGDGDRIGVIDDEGEILWGDQILLLLARETIAENPGATVIADVKASQVLFDGIAALGGTPLMWRTGHSLIKTKMQESGALLAGEMSGHIFFADHYYGYDDALYAAVRLLSILASEEIQLSVFRQSLPVVLNTPEIRLPCPESDKARVIDGIKAQLRSRGVPFNDLDGIRAQNDDGWWLLRASNTQEVLVARCEASNPEALARMFKEISGYLEIYEIALPDV